MNKVVIDTLYTILITFIIVVILEDTSIHTLGLKTATRSIHHGIHTSRCHAKTGHEHDIGVTLTNDDENDQYELINSIDGPFHSTQIQDYWGNRPLLVRNAFPPTLHQHAWPSWEDIVRLSCDDCPSSSLSPSSSASEDEKNNNYDIQIESGESARLIQHVPGKLDTFTVEVGPFDRRNLQRQMTTTKVSNGNRNRKVPQKVWTLLLNDVERYYPVLDIWMNEHFHFLPRWRRDDAQISCTSAIHGGIGPHVDNYDVCLIQISGQRVWRIMLVSPSNETMSHHLEQQLLIPNIPVSVLNLTVAETTWELNQSRWVEFRLDEGDMLYLPPRYVHWGLGQSTDCMTLSVGARAPSASDVLIRITEHVQQTRLPWSSLQRYIDTESSVAFLRKDALYSESNHRNDTMRIDPDGESKQPTLSASFKGSMKSLVQNMMNDIMNDESMWDMIVGKLITDPLRYSDSFPVPFSDAELMNTQPKDILDQLSPYDMIQSIQQLGDRASLRKVPGISSATSQVRLPSTMTCNHSNSHFVDTHCTIIDRLYAHGEMYEVISNGTDQNPTLASTFFQRIDDSLPINGTMVRNSINDGPNPMLLQVLQELMKDGIIRPYFDPSV